MRQRQRCIFSRNKLTVFSLYSSPSRTIIGILYGRIPGAVMRRNVWLISKNAEKPIDGRTKRERRNRLIMNKHKILLIEDDAEISEMLKNYLTTENYEVACAADGQAACTLFDGNAFSLVLLDLMIPQISGMDVMQHIRKNSVVPIIIISAKDSEADKTLGLSLGADDYITKPFSVVEVLARIKANIRRTTQYDNAAIVAPAILAAGDLIMNLSDYTLTKRGKKVELTAKEFEILKLFLQNPKKVYTKEQVYSLVWHDAYCGDENAVNVHISRLRNKIEDDTRNPRYVITVWGLVISWGKYYE